MIILGVDPGTLITGYAVIDCTSGKTQVLDCNIIRMNAVNSIPSRLQTIYKQLNKVIKKYKPNEFVIETAFYQKNVQSTLKLGQARGVSLLAAINNDININEYSPREIKKAVTGYGNASKEQVKFMISKIINYKTNSKILDYTDAIAVALCHYNKLIYDLNEKSQRKWSDFVLNNPQRIKSIQNDRLHKG